MAKINKSKEINKIKNTAEAPKETAANVIANVKEAVKDTAKEVKETVKEVKETAKTKTAAKAPAKKEAAPAKAPKKTAKETSFVEFEGKQLSVSEITENAKKHWLASNKGTISDIKVYINTNQSKAFYVVNNEDRGEFDI
ncbi:MAG: DUF6465 family protein [Oscillospiraceae bacterium]|nr:DUF6465 family protein [Oscillospiraceae bacterium]